MRLGDAQLGTPYIQYVDSKSNIEALTGMLVGATAVATDNPTAPLGAYNGSAWVWGGSGGGGFVSGTGTQYYLPVWTTPTEVGALASLGALNSVLLSAGAGANPAWSTFTFSGTASQVYTFPSTSATLAGLAIQQSFTNLNTFTRQTFIDGSADETVLRVQAHSTMTLASAFIQTWENSSAVKYAYIDKDGKFIISRGGSASNTFVGGAGNTTTTANPNVGIGEFALASLTTGTQNYGLGYGALFRLQGGSNNVSIGTNSLAFLVSGTGNVAIGQSAGYNGTESNNTFIGYLSGFTQQYGNNNIFIGAFAGYRQGTITGRLIIDNQLRASAAEEATNAILYGLMAAAPANQTLQVNALLTSKQGRRKAVTISATNLTLTANHEVVVFTSNATATLPAATGTGQTYRIIARGATVTIDGNGTDTIKGELTQIITGNEDFIITDTASGKWE